MRYKQKVLIVDDEPRNQRIITEIMEGSVELKTASSGEEALEVVSLFKPDLIFLDIMMPGIDGYEVCQKIKADPAQSLTKVILVSGKAMVEERLRGYTAGADDYMTKPFIPEELLAKAKVFLQITLLEKKLANMNNSLEEQVRYRTQQLLMTEARLIDTAKMAALGEMAGGIAHEINTPLAIIKINSEQIEEVLTKLPIDSQMIDRMAKTIVRTVDRIGVIVRGLRTFASGGSQDRLDHTPLQNIVDDTLVLCRERLKHDSIEMRLDPIPANFNCECRSVQISQVLLNLVQNASDAIQSLPEKWIHIKIINIGSFYEISVTDSGTGISQGVRDKIFDPFFTTKDVGKGTGLGLSISKGIIDAHYGSLYLNHKSTNTQFVVRLPVQHPHSERVTPIKVS